jgi:hypothetical protein
MCGDLGAAGAALECATWLRGHLLGPCHAELSMNDPKAEMELAVFRQFAAAARVLDVDPASIEKRCPNEPDIRCRGRDGPLAVELVELLDENVARDQGDAARLQEALMSELSTSNLATLRGRLIRVRFRDEAPQAKKLAAIPAIIQALTQLPSGYSGSLVPPADVTILDVCPWAENVKPLPAVYAGGGWLPPVSIAGVRAKFGKSYTTDSPIELLAYYQRQPVGTELWEHPDLCQLIQSELRGFSL